MSSFETVRSHCWHVLSQVERGFCQVRIAPHAARPYKPVPCSASGPRHVTEPQKALGSYGAYWAVHMLQQ